MDSAWSVNWSDWRCMPLLSQIDWRCYRKSKASLHCNFQIGLDGFDRRQCCKEQWYLDMFATMFSSLEMRATLHIRNSCQEDSFCGLAINNGVRWHSYVTKKCHCKFQFLGRAHQALWLKDHWTIARPMVANWNSSWLGRMVGSSLYAQFPLHIMYSKIQLNNQQF